MKMRQAKLSFTIRELASKTEQILEEVRQTGQPVSITIDGKPVAVLLDVAHYERLEHLLSLSRMLHEAEADIREAAYNPSKISWTS
jgi:prevent-host-death family protein